MWQDNFGFKAFADRGFAFVVVDSQRYDVCDHSGNRPGVEAAHGQNTSKNGILVSTWKVGTAHNQT